MDNGPIVFGTLVRGNERIRRDVEETIADGTLTDRSGGVVCEVEVDIAERFPHNTPTLGETLEHTAAKALRQWLLRTGSILAKNVPAGVSETARIGSTDG